ncbi:glycosyltransferase family 39 protein [Portibacter lacus]|uniref:Glycosyltransferase RgtA/B/C/D-like domain-containing protein n=1 Tax=Portibacter lacus TaxID=1099794 RepID=A0AA37SPE7_9BACT|nr:glycosyltransferase family 39 protein [Portibacter lacus]GLR16338.1 hypothetical protein GCM10007940_09530 [Portibacter lacus]
MAQKKKNTKKASVKPQTKRVNPKPKKSINVNYDYIFLGLLIGLIILIYFIRVNFFDMPLERDEGDYGLAGKLILEGATPYVDVFEQKPPGLFYSYAFVEALFGTSSRNLHVGFMVVNMVTVVLLAYGIKFIMNPLAAIVAAYVYAILSINPYASGFAVQAEHLLIFYVSISFFMLAYFYKSENKLALIAAGAAVAWSATIKQNGIFFIAAMTIGVGAIHLAKQKLDLRKLIIEYSYLAIGGIGMFIIVCLLMLVQGVWQEFIFWSITFPREFYISEIPFSQGMTFMKGYFTNISAYDIWMWYGGIAGLVLVLFSKLKWGIKVWIITIAAFAFFSIWPGYRFYGHYWIQLFFGIAIAMAALVYSITDLLSRKLSKPISYGIPLLIFIVFATFYFNKNKGYYFSPNADSIMNAIYGDNPFVECRTIAEFIKSKNPDPKSDKLLVVGSEPQILLETGLQSPTPFTFIMFMTSTLEINKEWQRAYLEMMKKNEAKYAVLVFHPFSWLPQNEEANQFFRETYAHLLEHYKVIGVADILNVTQTVYKWDAEAGAYQPQGDKYVLVFERR